MNENIYEKEYRKQRENYKKWSVKKCILFVIIAIVFAVMVGQITYLHQLQQQVADKVIRFHVLANSDSSADQELKLAVRDCVGTYLGEQLEGVKDVETGKNRILSYLDEIEDCASDEIAKRGYDYPVSASLETCHFPIKAYGKAVFPPGNYQALRIVIGEGEGKNWWCVLYPNLCFSGSLYSIDEDASTEKLKAVLSPEEYKMLMENKEYEVRFKFYEMIQRLKK